MQNNGHSARPLGLTGLMSRMALIALIAVGGAAGGAAVQAQATTPATTAAATAPSPEAVGTLQLLQDRDQTLKDFTATIRYEVYHPRTDDTEVRKGDVSYLKADEIAKFAAHFTLQGVGGSFSKVDRTLVFDGRWIIDRDAEAKVFKKVQIVPPDSKVKPLKLGEGPMPIPIGQDTQRVLHDFAVSVEPTDPKMPDASEVVHLKLVPGSKELTKAYDMNNLEIWVNRKIELPVKLVREDLDGNITTIALSDPQINQGAAKIFDLPTPKSNEGWDVRIERMEQKGGDSAE